MMTSRIGTGSRSRPASRISSYSFASRAPASLKSRYLLAISPLIALRIRSARCRSSLPRLDSEPATCGKPSRSWAADSNFMSTKITMNVSGECVSAIPLHNDKKNSDLPEPGRPDHDGVKTEAAEVFCAEDDVLQLAAGLHADRHHRPLRVAPAAAIGPQPVDVELARIVDPQRPQQFTCLAVGFGQFPGAHRRPARQGPRIPVGGALGEHVGHRVERIAVIKPAFAQLETLVFVGKTHAEAGSGRQPQHGDAGHALLSGHALPLLGCSDAVVDNHPMRAQRANPTTPSARASTSGWSRPAASMGRGPCGAARRRALLPARWARRTPGGADRRRRTSRRAGCAAATPATTTARDGGLPP